MTEELTETVQIKILNQLYTIACPAAQKEGLMAAADYLHQKLIETRQSNPSLSLERSAILTAMHISYDLISLQSELDFQQQHLDERIESMNAKATNFIRKMDIK